MTWNRPKSETELLRQLWERLRSRLPASWDSDLETQSTLDRGGQRSLWRPDGRFTIQDPTGRSAEVLVEAKNRLEPNEIAGLVAQLRTYGAQNALVAAQYLSPRARELLVEAGVGYADATGNLRLSLERPALFIQTAGADKDPWPSTRSLRSLRGPAAGRAVRAVCDFAPPYGVRELAERSSTSLASIARVVDLLDRERIVEREPRGPVTSVDLRALLERWARDYTFSTTNDVRTFLEPRGTDALRDKLRGIGSACAVTGSLAAARLAPVAPARLAAIYVRSADDVAEQLDLRPVEVGANVILAEPFDEVVFERTSVGEDGITYCAPSQVAIDLLTGPGRAPSEGEALIGWMEGNLDAWRS